jgi:carboxypeptidase Taq
VRGDLEVADLPVAWGDGMQRLLGLRPPSDADGVMQDIHWADGLFGYFPTYTLGNLYAAQLAEALEERHGPLEGLVERGDFAPVLGFLRERVHSHGRRADTPDLMRAATGRELSTDAFLAHLGRAYS